MDLRQPELPEIFIKMKKYYRSRHQYNVRNITYGANATNNIASKILYAQTLLVFHFVGLGFSVFENSYSTLYLKFSEIHFDRLRYGIQALKVKHASFDVSAHCIVYAAHRVSNISEISMGDS